MRGWAAVAWLAGVPAAVTGLWVWWRWRRFGAAWWVSPVGRHRRRDPSPAGWWWLLGGLATGFNGGSLAVRNPTGGDHVVGVVALVVSAVVVTLGVGGLLIGRAGNRG
jgi:hypothetical protein